MKRWIWKLAWLTAFVATFIPPAWADADVMEPLLPFRYAYVGGTQAAVYSTPGDPTQTVAVRHFPPASVWVSIKDQVEVDGRVWYRIGEEEYVLASDVLLASPSPFRGVLVGQTYDPPLGFVVADTLNVRASAGVTADDPPLTTLPRYTVVKVEGQLTADDGVWYQIGPGEYAHSAYVRVVTMTPRPSEVSPDDKWIAVNLAEQTLAAYEGDRMVFATLVSTGLPWWRTPEGLFRLWAKLKVGKMSGGNLEDGNHYYLQDVPWIMYFDRGYGLHAAYWHDSFGHPRSRGCVNLSPGDAQWIFDWTSPPLAEGQQMLLSTEDNPGTWVYVHSTPADLTLVNALPERAGRDLVPRGLSHRLALLRESKWRRPVKSF
jgi:lipoprotein-anchoring transpeptidase ErfK/SrfK